MRRISESMGDQIDKMTDLSLEQKEYMHQFLEMSPKYRDIIIETLLEG